MRKSTKNKWVKLVFSWSVHSKSVIYIKSDIWIRISVRGLYFVTQFTFWFKFIKSIENLLRYFKEFAWFQCNVKMNFKIVIKLEIPNALCCVRQNRYCTHFIFIFSADWTVKLICIEDLIIGLQKV